MLASTLSTQNMRRRYQWHKKKNQTSKEVVRTEHVYGIGFTATASVETANVENVFIMREGCHVDMTGCLGVKRKVALSIPG